MTTMAGNGPLPSGRATYAPMASPLCPFMETVPAIMPSYWLVWYIRASCSGEGLGESDVPWSGRLVAAGGGAAGAVGPRGRVDMVEAGAIVPQDLAADLVGERQPEELLHRLRERAV